MLSPRSCGKRASRSGTAGSWAAASTPGPSEPAVWWRPRDSTRRPKGTSDTNCYGGNPRNEDNRRWEIAGRKFALATVHYRMKNGQFVLDKKGRKIVDYYENTDAYLKSATMFHGWEGGRGPEDCEPLYRPFVGNQLYGAFMFISLNEGWAVK